jgi:hypothetical protein
MTDEAQSPPDAATTSPGNQPGDLLAREPKPPRPTLSLWKTVLFCALGIVAIATGLQQILGGGDQREINRLLTEAEAATGNWSKLMEASQPSLIEFDRLLNSMSITAIRTSHQSLLKDVSEQLAEAIAQLRLAEKKIREALDLRLNEQGRTYLTHKASSLKSLADAHDNKRKIVELVRHSTDADAAVIEQIRDLSAQINNQMKDAEASGMKANEAAKLAEKKDG